MPRYFRFDFVLALCGSLAGALTQPACAAGPPPKQTVMVPMRDGVHLATDVRLPAGDGPWPVALVRTPYDRRPPLEAPWPVVQFAQNGIVLVVQDVRGQYAS